MIEHKTIKQVLIWSRLFGFLLLVTATIIQIAVVPLMDNQINELSKKLDESYMKEQTALQQMADIRFIQVFEELYLFQSNLYLNNKDKILSVKKLREEALNKAITAAKAVDDVLPGGEGKRLEEITEKKINNILSDKHLSIDGKRERVDQIFYDNLNKVNQRLKALSTDRNQTKEKMNKDKINRSCWNNWFLIFQILGLGFLSLPEVFEKFINHHKDSRSE